MTSGVYTGNPFTASATATGVGGAPVSGSFAFTYYTGTSVNGSGSSDPPTNVGTYTVVAAFTSSDANYTNGQSSPVTFTISFPVILISPGDQTNTVGDDVNLPMLAYDNDGLPLSFSATGLPPGLAIDSYTGIITGTIPASTAPSSFTATVTATDGPSSASTTWTWDLVLPLEVFLDDPGDQVNADGETVSLALTAIDLLGSPLTYSATGLPPGLQIDSTTGEITGTISSSAHSSTPYAVTLTATDGTYSDSQTLDWTITPAVLLTNPGDQTNGVGDTVSLTLAATDSA